MKNGLLPTPYDSRDYDFHKTFGAAVAPDFPESYNADAGLWMPNQNFGSDLFDPAVPPMPFGCTNYSQADLCADDDQELKNPVRLEEITHANAKGGIDMRTSLNAAKKVFGRTAYFNIRPTYPLDFFDAVRLAMWSTKDEGRTVSAGTPFYPEWGNPIPDGRLAIPASFDTIQVPWHNWKIAGWKTIHGKPHLLCKMWTGPTYGDNGWAYMSRELFNAVMTVNGTAAYTMTKIGDADVQKVDFELVSFIVSLVRWAFGLDEPAAPLVIPPEPPKPIEPPVPAPKVETAAERLVEAGVAALGMDMTPDDKVPDEVACVAQLVAIVPAEFGLSRSLTYTPNLKNALDANPKFKRVQDPHRGTIVVSVTEGEQHGHCGLYLEDDSIASNNSNNGKWEVNFNRAKWRSYFGDKLGLKGYLYDPVDTPVA